LFFIEEIDIPDPNPKIFMPEFTRAWNLRVRVRKVDFPQLEKSFPYFSNSCIEECRFVSWKENCPGEQFCLPGPAEKYCPGKKRVKVEKKNPLESSFPLFYPSKAGMWKITFPGKSLFHHQIKYDGVSLLGVWKTQFFTRAILFYDTNTYVHVEHKM
jgi:hypothetical protein